MLGKRTKSGASIATATTPEGAAADGMKRVDAVPVTVLPAAEGVAVVAATDAVPVAPATEEAVAAATASGAVAVATATVSSDAVGAVPEANSGSAGAAGWSPEGGKREPKPRKSRAGQMTLRWTPKEDELLLALVEQYGSRGHWSEIAAQLPVARTPGAVDQHWNILTGKRTKPSGGSKAAADGGVATYVDSEVFVEATASDDADAAAAEGGEPGAAGSSADAVVAAIEVVAVVDGGGDEPPGKRRRSRKNVVTQRWTEAEEAVLLSSVKELGTRGKWGQIAERIGNGRTASAADQHWQVLTGRRVKRQSGANSQGADGGDVLECEAVAEALTDDDPA